MLPGEVSLGQTQREYRDPSLPNVSGLVYDSSLIYAATPLPQTIALRMPIPGSGAPWRL